METAANIISGTKKLIGKCNKHNIPLKMPAGGPPIPFCSKCIEELTLKEQKDKENIKLEEKKISSLKKAFDGIRIGKRFKDATFDDFKEDNPKAKKVKSACVKYAATFPTRLKSGDGLILSGNIGTGKNMLAACIARAAVEAGHTSLHTTVLKMVRKVKKTWNTKECEQAAIDSFSEPDLLIINEVGVQFESKTEELYLFQISMRLS
jgi:DNA replication protein DnaC